MSATQTVQYAVEMTAPMKEIIDDLATQSKMTPAEVLTLAVGLLRAVKTIQQQSGGGEPAVVKDGRVITTLKGL
jgi:hypothetical protein